MCGVEVSSVNCQFRGHLLHSYMLIYCFDTQRVHAPSRLWCFPEVLVVVHVTLLCLIALFTSSDHMKYGSLHHNKTKPPFVMLSQLCCDCECLLIPG